MVNAKAASVRMRLPARCGGEGSVAWRTIVVMSPAIPMTIQTKNEGTTYLCDAINPSDISLLFVSIKLK